MKGLPFYLCGDEYSTNFSTKHQLMFLRSVRTSQTCNQGRLQEWYPPLDSPALINRMKIRLFKEKTSANPLLKSHQGFAFQWFHVTNVMRQETRELQRLHPTFLKKKQSFANMFYMVCTIHLVKFKQIFKQPTLGNYIIHLSKPVINCCWFIVWRIASIVWYWRRQWYMCWNHCGKMISPMGRQ